MERVSFASYDGPVPRYTSYPTAAQFDAAVGPAQHEKWLRHLNGVFAALYLHVPFCRQLCWYCACNTMAMRREGTLDAYAEALGRELDLLAAVAPDLIVESIQWGGGTPTQLGAGRLAALGLPDRRAVRPARRRGSLHGSRSALLRCRDRRGDGRVGRHAGEPRCAGFRCRGSGGDQPAAELRGDGSGLAAAARRGDFGVQHRPGLWPAAPDARDLVADARPGPGARARPLRRLRLRPRAVDEAAPETDRRRDAAGRPAARRHGGAGGRAPGRRRLCTDRARSLRQGGRQAGARRDRRPPAPELPGLRGRRFGLGRGRRRLGDLVPARGLFAEYRGRRAIHGGHRGRAVRHGPRRRRQRRRPAAGRHHRPPDVPLRGRYRQGLPQTAGSNRTTSSLPSAISRRSCATGWSRSTAGASP